MLKTHLGRAHAKGGGREPSVPEENGGGSQPLGESHDQKKKSLRTQIPAFSSDLFVEPKKNIKEMKLIVSGHDINTLLLSSPLERKVKGENKALREASMPPEYGLFYYFLLGFKKEVIDFGWVEKKTAYQKLSQIIEKK